MQFFSLVTPFVSRGYNCKCMLRIIKYFQYYILCISFRTNIFSPMMFVAARITIRAISLHFVGAPLPRSPVFCHPAIQVSIICYFLSGLTSLCTFIPGLVFYRIFLIMVKYQPNSIISFTFMMNKACHPDGIMGVVLLKINVQQNNLVNQHLLGFWKQL